MMLPIRLYGGRVPVIKENPMQYMLLIYLNGAELAELDKADHAKLHQEYTAFTDSLKKNGQYMANNGLAPAAKAKSVRVKNGKAVTTDGPFVETRELLAGYYLVEAKDMDEALGLAERIPGARHGGVEVRPLWSNG